MKGGEEILNLPPRVRSRAWCLTLNNYTQDEKLKMAQYFEKKDQWIIGVEGKDATPHLQAYFKSKNPIDFGKVKKLFPRAHIEKALGGAKQNWVYCSKENDFTSNMDFRSFKDKVKNQLLESEYKDVEWRPWQTEILELKNDDRTINWYWEATGNKGKSYLSKYIALTRKVIICDGKKADIFNQVNMMMDKEQLPEVIICDIPRTSIDYINYGALEQLKNGMLYSGKYEGGVCLFPPPLVICLANTAPDLTAMSEDRWNVIEII